MRTWTSEQIAHAAGASLITPPRTDAGPDRVTIDSREAGPGALFVGLKGERDDGGRYAPQALAVGAWGILTTPEHAQAAAAEGAGRLAGAAGVAAAVLLAADDPLKALQHLATA